MDNINFIENPTYNQFNYYKETYNSSYKNKLKKIAADIISRKDDFPQFICLKFEDVILKVKFDWLIDDLLDYLSQLKEEYACKIEQVIKELELLIKKAECYFNDFVEEVDFISDKLLEYQENQSEEQLKEDLVKMEKAASLLKEVFGDDLISIDIIFKKGNDDD